jgi:hypothetical protein
MSLLLNVLHLLPGEPSLQMGQKAGWAPELFYTMGEENSIAHTGIQIKTTLQNGVFWDVTPCDSCKNQRFGGT